MTVEEVAYHTTYYCTGTGTIPYRYSTVTVLLGTERTVCSVRHENFVVYSSLFTHIVGNPSGVPGKSHVCSNSDSTICNSFIRIGLVE
jgi:hypothetical protein